jgi:hypothetical protein
VEDYTRVRLAHRDGMGLNELARTFHHSKRKIRQILAEAEPRRYPQRPLQPSILDPFKPLIDAILAADEQAPPKQRHTATKLFRRLRDEHGYTGGPERVRLYIRSVQRRHVETFIPLDHDPGQRLEADFGHIYADFPGGRQQVPVLLVTWAYSNCPFALALLQHADELARPGGRPQLPFQALPQLGKDGRQFPAAKDVGMLQGGRPPAQGGQVVQRVEDLHPGRVRARVAGDHLGPAGVAPADHPQPFPRALV